MNIELLQGTLSVSPNPGLDTFDERLSDIATLVQEGKYEEAAAQVEAILTEKIYDIRIIGYFLYGHFLEKGVGAMADIYQGLTDLLRENLEALGPTKNREKHIQTILSWLMKQLLKKMQYEEGKKSDSYEAWTAEVSSDQVQEALDAGDELHRILGPLLEDSAGPVLDGLMKVNDWLTTFQRLVYREPEPEAEPEPEEVEAEEWEDDEADEIEEEVEGWESKKDSVISATEDEDLVSVEGSYHLKLLDRKLEAFDYLISEKKYPSAALLADDIKDIIANFDPTLYFPKLFARFFLQLAANIDELIVFEEHKNTTEWQVMQELLKVDIDSFVNFKSERGGHENVEEEGIYNEEDEDEDDELLTDQ